MPFIMAFSTVYAAQAATLAMADRIDEAKLVARRLLELEPTFRTKPSQDFVGVRATGDCERLVSGLS